MSVDSQGIPCLLMRGGTSKGAVMLAEDLPSDEASRDKLLLSLMGSPDPRQIDGLGGADPLTSKVAILSRSEMPDADVDYLFQQVFVDQALVSGAQGCGNILAAVGPAAIERGLVAAKDGTTPVRIHMVNTGKIAEALVETPRGMVSYEGKASIDGVPGSHAGVELWFDCLAGSMCGALLPSGNVVDEINGVTCTLIDNGMPCVIMDATSFGVTGAENLDALEADEGLREKLEAIRLKAGPLMGLGDVSEKSVPKMTLVLAPAQGGIIATRSWIPHRVHSTIGVFAAVTVATAALMPGTPAAHLAVIPDGPSFPVEHPSGAAEVLIERDAEYQITRSGMVRTARKIMDGLVFPKTA